MMLFGASTVLLLPAIAWTGFSLARSISRPAASSAARSTPSTRHPARALRLRRRQGRGDAASFLAAAAMVAPTPVSALLHAVAVVKAGVFTILKVVVYVFGVDTLAASDGGDWLVVAGITVISASLIALRQDNLKRRLAYSTISQLSYVVLGAALFTPLAILGAALHIAAHAVSKITLFFAAGSIHIGAHVDEVSRMDGVGRKMPWTMGAFAVGALSMIGVPPTAGFLGKWFILLGGGADREMVRRRRDRGLDAPQRRLLPADRLPRVLPRGARGGQRGRPTRIRRSALADRGRADGDGSRHGALVSYRPRFPMRWPER